MDVSQDYEMPEDAPEIPDPPQGQPHQGDDNNFIGDKQELLEELNKAKVPTDVAEQFWHFNSNTLSASFLDQDDERDFHNLFWVSNEMTLKQYKANSITPQMFNNIAQIYLHGKARLKQSKGTLNSGRTNMLTLFTKVFRVVENTLQSNEGGGKKRFWG